MATATQHRIRWTRITPGFYTAHGGWHLMHDPDPAAPDRPWALRRHGRHTIRCHTKRIATLTADQITTREARP